MAKNNNLTDFVRDLADGFREKTGTATEWKINPQNFSEWLTSIPATRSFRKFLNSLQMSNIQIPAGSNYAYEPVSNLTNDVPQELVVNGDMPLYPVIRLDITLADNLPDGDYVSITDAVSPEYGSLPLLGKLSRQGDTYSHYILLLPNMADTGKKTLTFAPVYIKHEDPVGSAINNAVVNISAEWVTMGLAPSGNYSVLSLRTGKGVIVQ